MENKIGKYITLSVRLVVDDSLKEEFIQGILKDYKSDTFYIEQCVPFCNLFIKDAKVTRIDRVIPLNTTTLTPFKFF